MTSVTTVGLSTMNTTVMDDAIPRMTASTDSRPRRPALTLRKHRTKPTPRRLSTETRCITHRSRVVPQSKHQV